MQAALAEAPCARNRGPVSRSAMRCMLPGGRAGAYNVA